MLSRAGRAIGLPTEFEWEVAAQGVDAAGNALASRALQTLPAAPCPDGRPRQMFGDVWQWTQSAYLPYPGYRAPPGALGEYNGKFMVGQQVLRGSSCATPDGHARATYRNFFYPPPALAVHGTAPCLGERMIGTNNKALRLPDVIAGPDREFAASVIEGLSMPRKSLPCRLFYDARGSELFEEITRLPEYYPTTNRDRDSRRTCGGDREPRG